MALNLEKTQTLAAGPFNPYIITPEWLVNNGVCEEQEVELRFTPMQQGMAFSFKDVQWQIELRMLTVASRKANCGELVARVMDKLLHTPVRAVGNNFHYAGSREGWGKSPLPMLGGSGRDSFQDVGAVEQIRWTGVFRMDGVRTEVTAADAESGIAVLFNFHREIKNTAEACAAARQFDQDRRRSQELLRRLFDQEVAL